MTQQQARQNASVVLTELADSLIEDLVNHRAGRTAKTVLSGTVMRATVIAMQEGTELAEHDAPAAATLYVIKGRVLVRAGDRDMNVEAGELVPIPHQRHSVEALTDVAFLLTVALH